MLRPQLVLLQIDPPVQQEFGGADRLIADAGIESGVVVRLHRHPMFQQPLCHPLLMLAREGAQDAGHLIARSDALVHQIHRGLEVQLFRNPAEKLRGHRSNLLRRALGDQVFGDVPAVICIGIEDHLTVEGGERLREAAF